MRLAVLKIKEAIVVEGRYDKNTLSQIVDSTIFETNGFGIFKDSQKMELLRRVAEKRGLIVFTDSEGHRVRDSNLSKTFNIEISKEALTHEFERHTTRSSPTAWVAERKRPAQKEDRLSGGRKRMAETCLV